MKKFISYVIVSLMSLVLGYWFGSTNVIEGTKADDALTYMTRKMMEFGEWGNERLGIPLGDLGAETAIFESAPIDSPSEEATSTMPATDHEHANVDDIDEQIVENRIYELLNELREENNLNTLASDEQLRKAANQRAREIEESFSHSRPDGSQTFTILEEEEYQYAYQLAGENLGMATYYMDEESMAELLFNGWVESQGHYENMIREGFEEVGIGVHYDGENLYAVQYFGTPLY